MRPLPFFFSIPPIRTTQSHVLGGGKCSTECPSSFLKNFSFFPIVFFFDLMSYQGSVRLGNAAPEISERGFCTN